MPRAAKPIRYAIYTRQYPDPEGRRTAMIRAARRAAEQAEQHNQPLLLWRDGRIVRIMPDELPDLPEQTLSDLNGYELSFNPAPECEDKRRDTLRVAAAREPVCGLVGPTIHR